MLPLCESGSHRFRTPTHRPIRPHTHKEQIISTFFFGRRKNTYSCTGTPARKNGHPFPQGICHLTALAGHRPCQFRGVEINLFGRTSTSRQLPDGHLQGEHEHFVRARTPDNLPPPHDTTLPRGYNVPGGGVPLQIMCPLHCIWCDNLPLFLFKPFLFEKGGVILGANIPPGGPAFSSGSPPPPPLNPNHGLACDRGHSEANPRAAAKEGPRRPPRRPGLAPAPWSCCRGQCLWEQKKLQGASAHGGDYGELFAPGGGGCGPRTPPPLRGAAAAWRGGIQGNPMLGLGKNIFKACSKLSANLLPGFWF